MKKLLLILMLGGLIINILVFQHVTSSHEKEWKPESLTISVDSANPESITANDNSENVTAAIFRFSSSSEDDTDIDSISILKYGDCELSDWSVFIDQKPLGSFSNSDSIVTIRDLDLTIPAGNTKLLTIKVSPTSRGNVSFQIISINTEPTILTLN
jgi:hypothetical protein